MKIASFLVFFSFILLPSIVFGAGDLGMVTCDGVDTACTFCTLMTMVNNLIQWLFTMLALIAVMMLMYAGVQLVVSRGNSHAMEEVKGMLTNIVIGFVIILSAWLIVDTVMKMLLNPEAKKGMWNSFEADCGGSAAKTTSPQGVSKNGRLTTQTVSPTSRLPGAVTPTQESNLTNFNTAVQPNTSGIGNSTRNISNQSVAPSGTGIGNATANISLLTQPKPQPTPSIPIAPAPTKKLIAADPSEALIARLGTSYPRSSQTEVPQLNLTDLAALTRARGETLTLTPEVARSILNNNTPAIDRDRAQAA